VIAFSIPTKYGMDLSNSCATILPDVKTNRRSLFGSMNLQERLRKSFSFPCSPKAPRNRLCEHRRQGSNEQNQESIFTGQVMSESANCQKLRQGIKAIRLELEELANAIADDRVGELPTDRDLTILIKPSNGFFDEITQADYLPEDDELYGKVILLITDLGYASTIVLQQKLGITYSQAVNIVAELERQGLVEPAHGFRPHKVLPAAFAARESLEISLEKQKHREYSRESLAIS
jgi:hypothetical protein